MLKKLVPTLLALAGFAHAQQNVPGQVSSGEAGFKMGCSVAAAASIPSCGDMPSGRQFRADKPAGWYSFAGVKHDQDAALGKHAPGFANLSGGGGSFTSLCQSIGRRCTKVVDWQGKAQSCSAGPDGTRAAHCD